MVVSQRVLYGFSSLGLFACIYMHIPDAVQLVLFIVARMEDTRLSKCVMFGELVEGVRAVWGTRKNSG